MKAQLLCFVSIKRQKMGLIYVFGVLVITSGVFSQDPTTVPAEVRGKLYLFRKHTPLTPTYKHSVLDLSKPVSFPPHLPQ